VGRRVLDRWQCQRFFVRRWLGSRGECRIFGFQPTQQTTPFFRVGCDYRNTPRRRQEGDGRRIDNLKGVKAQGMEDEGRDKKSREREFPTARLFPGKDQAQVPERQRSTHFEGVVASATEAIPRSRARFVTSTTSV